jgi:hypothetical protein
VWSGFGAGFGYSVNVGFLRRFGLSWGLKFGFSTAARSASEGVTGSDPIGAVRNARALTIPNASRRKIEKAFWACKTGAFVHRRHWFGIAQAALTGCNNIVR